MTIVPENEILNLCFLVSWNPFRVLDFVFRAGSKFSTCFLIFFKFTNVHLKFSHLENHKNHLKLTKMNIS